MSAHDEARAIVLDPDGTVMVYDRSAARTPDAWLSWAHGQLSGDRCDVATGYDRALVLVCPDLMYGDFPWAHGRPADFNWRASALYGRSPLYGRVVVYRDDHLPLDPPLVAAVQAGAAMLMEYTVRTHPALPDDADDAEVQSYVRQYVDRLDRYSPAT